MKQIVYKPKEFAGLIGKSVITLQRWDRVGRLVAKRSHSNRRYYTHQQYLEYIGIHASSQGKVVAYCRSSCAINMDDVASQKLHIIQHAHAFDQQIEEWFIDYNSSLNYQREQFNNLLDQIELGQIAILFLAHKDRLVRFGYEWFAAFCERHGTQICLVNSSQFTPDKKELLSELKLIINMFAGKIEQLGLYKEEFMLLLDNVEKELEH